MKIKISKYLDEKALDRLDNILFSNPSFGLKLMSYIYFLIESGYISKPITDQELKEIAKKLLGEKRETSIRRL